MGHIAGLSSSAGGSLHAVKVKELSDSEKSAAIDKKMDTARDKWIKGINAFMIFSACGVVIAAAVVLSGGSLFALLALPVAFKVAFLVAPFVLCGLGNVAKHKIRLHFNHKGISEKEFVGLLPKAPSKGQVKRLQTEIETAISDFEKLEKRPLERQKYLKVLEGLKGELDSTSLDFARYFEIRRELGLANNFLDDQYSDF